MRKKISALLSSCTLLLLSVLIVTAQTNCAALLDDALFAVEDNCGDTGRNEACYGFDQVEASFISTIDDTTFSQPTDLAPVADIASIRTAPLNLEQGTWGVAVMNLQADLPDTLPGQTVTFILLGDVEVENAVDPADAFDPADGIDVTVTATNGANIRSGPGLTFNVIGGAPTNNTLVADGISEDGGWLRIAYRERPAWVSLDVIADDDAIAELPTLSPDLRTPMQAFFLRTGIGQPECNEAPDDILLVQGPEDIEVSITVNGADINLGSSGALRLVEEDGVFFLEIIVFDGVFETGGQTVTAGQSTRMPLGTAEDVSGLDGEDNELVVIGPASEPITIDLQEFGLDWCAVGDLPPAILNYGIEVNCDGEEPPVFTTNTGTGTSGTNTTSTDGTSPVTSVEDVDCSAFSILTTSFPSNVFTLSWTPAVGADEYHVALFDESGFNSRTITDITDTSVVVNGGEGFAGTGSVHVRAYLNDEYVCFTQVGFTRAPDPQEPVGGYDGNSRNISVSITCFIYGGGDDYSIEVTWSNATAPIDIFVQNNSAFSEELSGTVNLFTGSPQPPGVVILTGDQTLEFTCTNFIEGNL
ncbi:MAG: hypothetical protein AAFR81_09065 [Chloroflexota bacterium]